MAKNTDVVTEAPVVSDVDRAKALMAYSEKFAPLAAARAELAEAEKSLAPQREAVEAAETEMRELIAQMGSDPLGAFKGSSKGGARGPRVPGKRKAVLSRMQDITAGELIAKVQSEAPEFNITDDYVRGIIGQLKPENHTRTGEKGSFRYTYTGELSDES